MSIEDRLQSGGRAWRESQPPVAVVPVEVRRKPVLWLPLTAAAATVAVVVGASLVVSRDDSPAPPQVIAVGSGGSGLETDAPPPLIPFTGSSYSPGATDACRAGDVQARLETSVPDGTVIAELILERTADASVCQLSSEAPRLELLDETGAPTGDAARYEDQPAVVNPPRTPRLLLAAGAPRVESDVRFDGTNCAATTAARLSGVTSDPISVAITGTGLPCLPGPQESGRLSMGLLHAAGDAHGLVPADRARLEASVEILSVDVDSVQYLARLTNTSDDIVTLDPCPRYAWLVEGADGSAVGGGGLRVDCAAVTESIAPGGRVEMTLSADSTSGQVARLTWGIAGTKNATDAVEASPVPPTGPTSTLEPTASSTPGEPCRAQDLEARFEGRRTVTLNGEPRVDRFLVVRKTTGGSCALRGTPRGSVFAQDGDAGFGVEVPAGKQPAPIELLLGAQDEAVAVLQHGVCPPPTGRTYFAFRLPNGDDLVADAPDEPAETDGGALRQCDLAAYAFTRRD